MISIILKDISFKFPKVISERFTIGHRIGNGAFGAVFECFD
jgi:hypothetical protein